MYANTENLTEELLANSHTRNNFPNSFSFSASVYSEFSKSTKVCSVYTGGLPEGLCLSEV